MDKSVIRSRLGFVFLIIFLILLFLGPNISMFLTSNIDFYAPLFVLGIPRLIFGILAGIFIPTFVLDKTRGFSFIARFLAILFGLFIMGLALLVFLGGTEGLMHMIKYELTF